MAINVLAPEWAPGKAWSDYSSVPLLKEGFDSLREADEVPWSRTHTYFANMSGFAIRFTEQTSQAEEKPKRCRVRCLSTIHHRRGLPFAYFSAQ